MKILIVGGNGLIGSYLTSILKQDFEVFIIDPNIYYFDFKPWQFKYLQYREELTKGCKKHRANLLNPTHLRRIINEIQPEKIINLAAYPLSEPSSDYSEEAVNSIFMGNLNLLEIIRDLKTVDQYVYASSSTRYGDFAKVPIKEEDPCFPKTPYAAAKLVSEIMVKTYEKCFHIPSTIIIPSAVYFNGDLNNRITGKFVENAVLGRDLIINGDGSTLADFTWCPDLCDGIRLILTNKDSIGQIYNLTRGEGRSLKELAEIIKSFIPFVNIVYDNSKYSGPNRGALDISKAKKILGYNPKISLEQGIEKYLSFVRECVKG